MQPLTSQLFLPIPTDTAQAARSVLQENNFYLAVGDRANCLFSGLILDAQREQFSKRIQTMNMLYLVTIFQFIEALPDHLAVDALKLRVDWKFALHLPLNHPGLEPSLLCKFRLWLSKDETGKQNMQILLSRLSEVMEETGRQGLCQDVSTVIDSVCQFSRLAKIWETIRQALDAIATHKPEWSKSINLPYWYIRYNRYNPRQQSLHQKVKCEELAAFAQVIGADGISLLRTIADSAELEDLPEILELQRVWQEQYEWTEGNLFWRKEASSFSCPAQQNKVTYYSKKEVSIA